MTSMKLRKTQPSNMENAIETQHESSPAPPRSQDKDRRAVYEVACRYLESVYTMAASYKEFSIDPLVSLIKRLTQPLASDDPLMIQVIHKDDVNNYVIRHGVNVAVYSIMMGMKLEFHPNQLVELGLSGLLHDVGMSRIPHRILYKTKSLTKEEIEIMRRHTEHGFEILKPLSHTYPFLAESALQHHERIDGSGYPVGLKLHEIHEYAQIIGLADMYETTIHSRPYRQRQHPFHAIKEILNTGKLLFQRRHLKALLNTFSLFPIQTFVRLNSGAVGKVIATYPDQPMRPRLQIVFDSQGRKVLTERIVNLPDDALLYIKDAVTNEELEALYQNEPH